MPDSNIGFRPWKETPSGIESVIDDYAEMQLSLYRLPYQTKNGSFNELTPRRLVLTQGATQYWKDAYNESEKELRPGGRLESVKGFGAKLVEHAARIAGVMTIVIDPDAVEIDSDMMAHGVEIAWHYAKEAMRLRERGSISAELARAAGLLRWLHEKGKDRTYAQEIYQFGPPDIRDKKSAADALTILEDHGWLTRTPGAEIGGARRKDAWLVIPPAA